MAARQPNDAEKTAFPNQAQPRHPKASQGQMTQRRREKGRKPVTANHLHLQPCTHSSGSKSQHRQGSPALSQPPCPSSSTPDLSSSPPPLQPALLFFVAFIFVPALKHHSAATHLPLHPPVSNTSLLSPPPHSSPMSPHSLNCLQQTLRHSLKTAHLKRRTHQRFLPQVTPQPQPMLLKESYFLFYFNLH